MTVAKAPPDIDGVLENEKDRMKSISVLRQRAFEQTSKLQENRESVVHQELASVRGELNAVRSQQKNEQAEAKVSAAALHCSWLLS